MAYMCPKCKKLQHYASRCKYCGYKEKRKNKKVTAEKLAKLKQYKVPDEYWIRKRKD